MKCNCGWVFIGDGDKQEALLAKIQHLQEEHFTAPDQEFEGENLELLSFIHQALFATDTGELGGWYQSQIDRMRIDADEIIRTEKGPEYGKHDYWEDSTRLSK